MLRTPSSNDRPVPMLRFLVVLCGALLLIGCGGGRVATDPPSLPDALPDSEEHGGASEEEPELALLAVWTGLDDAFAGLAGRAQEACDASFATWFEDFGVRGLACAAAEVVAPTSFVARAPVVPFRSGPHIVTADRVQLDLNVHDFGQYDPAFVTWLVEHGIPAADSPARALTQPVYDRRVRRLARIYWLTYADLETNGFPDKVPAGPLADYSMYVYGGFVPDDVHNVAENGFSVSVFTERSETLLPQIGVPIGNEWTVKYEANTAYGFWIRRRFDGTLGVWHDGLRRLLQTYDAAWLAEAE